MTPAPFELRRTVLHRALHRPNLLMGGERELMLMTLIVTGGLAMSALNVPTFVVCGTVWVVVAAILRLMAKADPMLSKVYTRSLRYRAYYLARSTAWRT